MWTYQIATGALRNAAGELVATGYAGHGAGLNNPDMQFVHGIGPLPVGTYTMGKPVDDPKLGPYAIPLIPDAENEMYGRDAFYIHGDEALHPGEHLASDGCIVQPHPARVTAWQSGDHRLGVIV